MKDEAPVKVSKFGPTSVALGELRELRMQLEDEFFLLMEHLSVILSPPVPQDPKVIEDMAEAAALTMDVRVEANAIKTLIARVQDINRRVEL